MIAEIIDRIMTKIHLKSMTGQLLMLGKRLLKETKLEVKETEQWKEEL